ncbi:MAG: bis(5'-nucleosyl)-tetraphosphatase [Candidatus ainarchaeum sp.]|nr:bis(5'-nucleosyl)-tetraphosphatase [Candidatus ainarchaeum sp.]
MPSEKSCGAVVFRGDGPERRYLLLHYEEGHWDFPKGHVEKGEAEKETARRETREETGLDDLVFVSGFRERIEYFYKSGGKTMHKEVFFFLARTRTESVRLSREHVGSAWLPYEGALARLTYDNAKGVLSKAHAFLQAAGKS